MDAGYCTEDIIPAAKGSKILLILNSSLFLRDLFSVRSMFDSYEGGALVRFYEIATFWRFTLASSNGVQQELLAKIVSITQGGTQ